jgi:hypothetical protein
MTTATADTHSEMQHYPRRTLSMPAWRLIAAGAVLGLAWGILARGWMRLIATSPEFTWSGTLFILAVSSVAGTSLAVVEALRRRGTRGWRNVAVVPALFMFAGPGMVLLPPTLLGALALSGRGPRSVRLAAAAVALSATVFVVWTDLSLHYSGVGGIGLVILCLALAAGWSSVVRSKPTSLSVFIEHTTSREHQLLR